MSELDHSPCREEVLRAEIERLMAENDMLRSLLIESSTKEERDEIFNRRFGAIKAEANKKAPQSP